MKIIRDFVERQTLERFADGYGLDLIVRERKNGLGQLSYTANLDKFELKEGGCLTSPFGSGLTEEAAILDYLPKISGRRAVIRPGQPNRVDFFVPILTSVR